MSPSLLRLPVREKPCHGLFYKHADYLSVSTLTHFKNINSSETISAYEYTCHKISKFYLPYIIYQHYSHGGIESIFIQISFSDHEKLSATSPPTDKIKVNYYKQIYNTKEKNNFVKNVEEQIIFKIKFHQKFHPNMSFIGNKKPYGVFHL
jgi:asparagine N-glycosylation enzyme membrane subunit Stt3